MISAENHISPDPCEDNRPGSGRSHERGFDASTDLDPADWAAFRLQGHRMLDDMVDHLQGLKDQPVWQNAPPAVRASMQAPLPVDPADLSDVHTTFKEMILPYGSGNIHPGFMGWVQGSGTPVGMLAEMLAAGLNANLGGRDHMPIAVERQITAWVREIFAFPESADGLFLTGTSQANFVAVLLARTRLCGADVRSGGLDPSRKLVAYSSTEVHGCIPRAMDMAGIGTANLHKIPVNSLGQIDLVALRLQIACDKRDGLLPFMVIGTAGTVNSGAVDDLTALARIAGDHGLHFHVDGALGALGMLSDDLAPLFAGIELCDSLAFDFHKWGHVPYDAGFLLVRDGAWQRQTFASDAAYLTRAKTGLAAGEWWPCDHGPDLSRGFRALKTWFTLKTYGLKALGASIDANCRLARALADRIDADPDLILMAPVALNIVCLAYARGGVMGAPTANGWIVEQLHAQGRVAPSVTLIDGRQVIRVAFVNHRSTMRDVDALIEGMKAFGALIQPPLESSDTMSITTSPAPRNIRPVADDTTRIMGLHRVLPMAYHGVDSSQIWEGLVQRVTRNDNDAAAMMDMSMILQSLSRPTEAMALLQEAVKIQRDYSVIHGNGQGLQLLAFVTPGDFMANTPLDFLLNGSNATLWLHYVDEHTADLENLPRHDVAMMAIGEANHHAPVLTRLGALLAGWNTPIMNNDPLLISSLTRDGVSDMLAAEPAILSPRTFRLDRTVLEAAAQADDGTNTIDGIAFPVIVRPIGTHAGFGLDRLYDLKALADYLKQEPADRFYVAPFIDYRGPDGLFSKQRIVFIKGKAFASHLALSDHWIVHYLSAGMSENPDKRAVEEAWMRDFDSDFAVRHAAAFAALYRHTGLDYFGIDCAELPDGRLLVFELDVAMVVHDMDDAGTFPYKKVAMQKLFDAFVAAAGDMPGPALANAA